MHQFDHTHVLGLVGICLDEGNSPYLLLPLTTVLASLLLGLPKGGSVRYRCTSVEAGPSSRYSKAGCCIDIHTYIGQVAFASQAMVVAAMLTDQ